MTDDERREVLAHRIKLERPVHSPLHLDGGWRNYLITAACFEHVPRIGHSIERMNAFTAALMDSLRESTTAIAAWVVLPNHYHALVASADILTLLKQLGQLHGRTSFQWNGEESTRGRQVWCNAAETVIKSDDHFSATVNYVHHNPVKHGYVEKWTDWPWSSAQDYLEAVGREEAQRQWQSHPIDRYGTGWDDAHL